MRCYACLPSRGAAPLPAGPAPKSSFDTGVRYRGGLSCLAPFDPQIGQHAHDDVAQRRPRAHFWFHDAYLGHAYLGHDSPRPVPAGMGELLDATRTGECVSGSPDFMRRSCTREPPPYADATWTQPNWNAVPELSAGWAGEDGRLVIAAFEGELIVTFGRRWGRTSAEQRYFD